MAVSKRLRYEVLRRDNHACRYCGAAAPETPLTVDHVLPKTLGGTDDSTNLVAACHPCNAGKSSSKPDTNLVADVNADALRWNHARHVAAEVMRAHNDMRFNQVTQVIEHWESLLGRQSEPADDAEDAIGHWIDRGLTPDDMLLLMINVVAPKVDREAVSTRNAWAYFAGCCWNRLRQIDATAQALIDNGEA